MQTPLPHKRILDHMATAVLVLDIELRVQYMNPAAENLLAVSIARREAPLVWDLFWEAAPGSADMLQTAVSTRQGYTKREAHLQLPSGQQLTVDYTVTPFHELGTPLMLLVEIRTLDRLLKISREDSIISAQQATRALVRGIAHEVKNPLGGIRGAAQLLAKELPNDELRDYTNVIISETDRLRNLVDRMLGPRTVPHYQYINIHEVIERVRNIISAEAHEKVNVIRDYDPSLPDVYADPDQLIQAILNIVRNAMQALLENPKQQNPSITLRSRALRQFTIGSIRHRLVICVEIIDNGPGIPNDLQETMFYPMVSGRAHGTGLGLSIAQNIINQHHGLIECDSIPGHTVFRLYIPLEPQNEP
ncbi:MAG TPA: nitrogen regulation protein NR(II) [Pseudomonadales bacterium]|nr:nitrogen regulation protein NR(II) [Pseudomonadales bacterium]